LSTLVVYRHSQQIKKTKNASGKRSKNAFYYTGCFNRKAYNENGEKLMIYVSVYMEKNLIKV